MPVLRQIALLGNPVLRTPAQAVPFPLPGEVRELIDDMLATMREADGVGIAAPQVHQSLAIFIVAPRPNPRYPDAVEEPPIVAINPEIVERSPETVLGWHRRILARYQDVQGEHVVREFEDFPARIFQHEDDHLRGVVFLDRMEDLRDLACEREYARRVAKG